MKTNAIYKRTYNQCLAAIAKAEIGSDLGTEIGLSQTFSVSRTTIRAIIEALTAAGILQLEGRRKTVCRHPRAPDYFPAPETESVRTIVEKRFMELVLHRDIRPGQQINNLDLARQFSVSPSAVREYLADFSQCGLLERRPGSSWIFRGFDHDFARELSDVRELFELEAAQKFADLAPEDPIWQTLARIEQAHRALLADMENRYQEFSQLDKALHSLINSVSHNRFVNNFDALRSLVFHYHYQWRKADEKQRNIAAIQEHFAYIAALQSRNRDTIRAAALAHLRTARGSLFASIERGSAASRPRATSEPEKALWAPSPPVALGQPVPSET
ncbi:MAG: GntR family transcriptional regulator [Azospirillaceae bacterium]|nr:GntR family transcriptional regulator [Azospirillaceae bacterium]